MYGLKLLLVKPNSGVNAAADPAQSSVSPLAFGLPAGDACMTSLMDGRPLALAATEALSTLRDVVAVAMCALLLCLLARCSKASLTRDLFGVVLAAAAVVGS